MPEVSVILPTCDRPLLVRRALASVLGQTFSDLEILLLDCNRRVPPVGENPAVADLLGDPRLRVIDARATRNASMSRNVGLGHARGRWITFLDDDDEYHREKIAAQHALAETSRAPIVLCGYEFVWPRRRRRRATARAVVRGDEIITCGALQTPLLFHRRGALRFDENIPVGHDLVYALAFLARHRVTEIPIVPRALVSVFPQPPGASVHSDKEAAWRGWRAAWKISHRHYSPRACRTLLALGRLERATGGYGDARHFRRCVAAVLRMRGLREWRLVVFSILTRWRIR